MKFLLVKLSTHHIQHTLISIYISEMKSTDTSNGNSFCLCSLNWTISLIWTFLCHLLLFHLDDQGVTILGRLLPQEELGVAGRGRGRGGARTGRGLGQSGVGQQGYYARGSGTLRVAAPGHRGRAKDVVCRDQSEAGRGWYRLPSPLGEPQPHVEQRHGEEHPIHKQEDQGGPGYPGVASRGRGIGGPGRGGGGARVLA